MSPHMVRQMRRLALGFFAGALLATTDARPVELSDLIDAVLINDVRYSPDGSRILFETVHADVEKGSYRIRLWLLDRDSSAARPLPVEQTFLSPYESNRARWTDSSNAFVYLRSTAEKPEARRFLIATNADEVVLRELGPAADPRGVPPDSFQLSPDGRTAAVMFGASATPPEPNKGIVAQLWWPYRQPTPNAGLWLKDVTSGEIHRVTPDDLHVTSFAWSPEGKRIAFCAGSSAADGHYKADLYLLKIATGEIQALVKQPGWERDPSWSPDGRTIAFLSQHGIQDWNYHSWIATVPAEGGEVHYHFDQFERDAGSAPLRMQWTDASHIAFWTGYRFDRAVFRGDLRTDTVERLTPEGVYARAFSVSPDGHGLAVAAESIARPTELFVTDLPWRSPGARTNLNPRWGEIDAPRTERISWRSRDGRFDVHGIVIEPPDFQPGRRYPMIVYLAGGPAMVRSGFNLDEGILAHLALAAKGYVIFAPNNRGRRGFGNEFLDAMPNHSDFMPGPWEDVIAGVDELVRRGIADPERLGLAGHSYGGGLAVYGAAHSTRFKAVSVFEGFPNMLRQSIRSVGSENGRLLFKQQRGFDGPWDAAAFDVLRRNSPVFDLNAKSPPALLEFGDLSAAREDGSELCAAWNYFHLPSLFIVYPHTGHSIDDPRLQLDSWRRQLAWFDYWVRNEGPNPLAGN